MEFTYLDYIKTIETNIFTVVYNYVKAIVFRHSKLNIIKFKI